MKICIRFKESIANYREKRLRNKLEELIKRYKVIFGLKEKYYNMITLRKYLEILLSEGIPRNPEYLISVAAVATTIQEAYRLWKWEEEYSENGDKSIIERCKRDKIWRLKKLFPNKGDLFWQRVNEYPYPHEKED